MVIRWITGCKILCITLFLYLAYVLAVTIITIILSTTWLASKNPTQVMRLGHPEPASAKAMAISVPVLASIPVNPKVIKVEGQLSILIPATNKFSFPSCFYRQTREYKTPQGQKQPLARGTSWWKMSFPSYSTCYWLWEKHSWGSEEEKGCVYVCVSASRACP